MLALILAATLWPNFDPQKVPVAVYDGKRTVLHNHPSPPPEFKDGVYEGRHPAVTGNSSLPIGGVETATVLATDPTPGLIAHEQFHVHQRTKHPAWSANEADLFTYPVDDAEALALLRRETDALRAALTGDKSAARLALEYRRQRFARIGETATKYERGSELNEGLAMYVQHLVDGGAVVLNDGPPDGVRDRVYQSGLAYALLLDRYDAKWRDTLENGDPRSLDELLAAAILPAIDVTSEIREVLAKREQRKREFLDRKGWTVVITAGAQPFFPARFDPLNVHVVGKGEILHTRFLQLTGIEILGRAALTEAAGEHPLFNGIRSVTLTGFATKPVIENDRLVAEGVTADLKGATYEIYTRE
ncbi:MAG TPA: hypothetical protein VF432_01220 [Thermoanaerobaculia bacterium]